MGLIKDGRMKTYIICLLVVVFVVVLLLGVAYYLKSKNDMNIRTFEQLLDKKEKEIEKLQQSISVLKNEQKKYYLQLKELRAQREQIKEPKDAQEVVQRMKEMGYNAYEKKD